MIALALAAAAMAQPPLQRLRFERALRTGAGPAELQPDGAMYAHSRSDFSDLRIVDGRGAQVPWRPEPEAADAAWRPVVVLDAGRRGGAAVARLDLGPEHGVVDEVTLDVPDRRFVGSVTVSGSDDRRTWTRLSTTQIYDVEGARPARSTTALLPPIDFRYLDVRATQVSRIAGATVASPPAQPRLEPVAARVVVGRRVVIVDLGHANVPADELRISSTTRRYNRPFTVVARGAVVAAGSLVGLGSSRTTTVPLAAHGRYFRIRIRNGDDPPLRGVTVEVRARPRLLLVEGGHPGPLTAYYGGAVRAPDYDYARLPVDALALDRATPATLGAERANPDFRVVDTRSFFTRHHALVTAALGLAGVVLVATAALALRKA